MRMHSLITLVGLAIGFAVPAFAQQKDTVDPQTIEQIDALAKKFDEAFDNGDAAALASLFTDDAVFVTPGGMIYGREAIEKYWVETFQQEHFSNHLNEADQY